jgi:hypothetical protein
MHPMYYLSDFEVSAAANVLARGTVAGVSVEENAIYVRDYRLLPLNGAKIRFNLTEPTAWYDVASIEKEKDYTRIALAPGSASAEADSWKLPALVALKIPLLFVVTLLVCALALYAMNLSFGLQLHFKPTMTVLLFALAGTGVALLVFAPISMLFTVVTESYHFMKVLHVVVFCAAGAFGVKILGEALLNMRAEPPTADPATGARHRPTRLIVSWLLLYCLVGAQLAWTLKPFLGTPYLPETPPFRLDKGNIFVSTIESFHSIRER